MLLAFLSVLMFVAGNDTLLAPAHVTAFKEHMPLERIAAPVSVVLASELKSEGIVRQNGLSYRVPGLLIPEYGSSMTSTIYLRGLGSRMENPVMGLYLDGIPVIEKNAYDFDWNSIRYAALMKGPQGTLYGRNSMTGTLVLESQSPTGEKSLQAFAEGGTAMTLRAGVTASVGRHVLSAGYKHSGGWFDNVYKGEKCDPYDGLSFHWKWEQPSGSKITLSNSLFATLSKEGGFAYGLYENGILNPVSYNDEGSYKRLSVLEGFKLRYELEDGRSVEGTASLQMLSDDMHMDQDFTPASVFTLQQQQNIATATLELLVRGESERWKRTTGAFAFYRYNDMYAPVIFKKDGIQTLILDNANSHIPADIGYLDISDSQLPIVSSFGIGTWEGALFHESVLTFDRLQLTAGVRLDYEGGLMNYDCLASLHYRFIPVMKADKALDVPFRGNLGRGSWQLLPKVSALVEAAEGLYFYGTVSKGYRAGGFNTQIFSDILQNITMNALMKDLGVHLDRPAVSVGADNTEYDPETAWNFEAGTRYVHEKFRAEASVYYMDVDKQQITVFPPGQSTGRMMANAGRSRSLGAEVEAQWNPGAFSFNLSYGWCDARFVSYNDGNNDYSGNRIPYVPAHTLFAGALWSHSIGKPLLSLQAFVRGGGPVSWDETGLLSEPFTLRLGSYVALSFPHWEIYCRGENLTATSSRNFYMKTVGREFFSLERPRSIVFGLSVKI